MPRISTTMLAAALAGASGLAVAAPLDPETQFYRPGPGAIADAIDHVEALRAEGREDAAGKVEAMIRQPMAVWLTQGTPGEVRAQVEQVMSAARSRGEVPILAAYNIPFRDCAQYSAGGATSVEQYNAWIDAIAEGVGDGEALVILEPDGLAIIPHATTSKGELDWCQPGEGDPETAEAERYEMTKYAVARLKENEGTRVYLDGGHADWHAPDEISYRMLKADIDKADGFFVNVSNYVETERSIAHAERVAKCVFHGLNGGDTNECTNDDAFYAEAVDPLIAEKGGEGLPRFVVDTSRNGNGVWQATAEYPDAQVWCNPPGRALGQPATTDTGSELADAYVWVKIPGESDGECSRGLTDADGVDPEWGIKDPAAGQWFREQVETLVGG